MNIMSKKYKLTAKEIVHAYENPQYLKDTFKECFETELEVGKWYKINESSYKGIIFITELELCKGFRKVHFYGIINNEFRTDYIANKGLEKLLQPSTEKEVEEALVKEAIKKYKSTDDIICLNSKKVYKFDEDYITEFKNNILWYKEKHYRTKNGTRN